jgi:hypothetical protein
VEQGPNEVDAVLNDCISRLRHRLRNCVHADRLDIHNIDYGFARNFAGLRPLWLIFLTLSVAGCWIGYVYFKGSPIWCAVSSVGFLIGILFSFGQERYVRVRARHYTDSFFSAVQELDEAEQKEKPAATKASKKDDAGKKDRPSDAEAR